MTYTIFGCNNPTGAYFLEFISGSDFEIWGRRNPDNISRFIYCDLSLSPQQPVEEVKGIVVSFAPIWLLARYLKKIYEEQPEKLKQLHAVIAISSSSYLTKQYAFSKYDKNLARSLNEAHQDIFDLCSSLAIDCHILAPTLVYGYIHGFSDRNVSKIIQLMRRLPFIFVPKSTGLRQPIHASQLAHVTKRVAEDILLKKYATESHLITALGGDDILTYREMMCRIRESLPVGDSGKNCLIIEVPDRLFLVFCAPLLIINTRLFEALMRINSNLSGFHRVSSLIKETPNRFPVLPLSP